MKRVSIIIPCLNEQDNIKVLYSALKSNERENYNYEYIFVDDGSTDATWDVLMSLKSTKSRLVQKIRFSSNYGHQSALHAGLSAATGDVHITMDADLQHPPSVVPKLITEYELGHNIVLAQRKVKIHSLKMILSSCFYSAYNTVVPQKIIPNAADFRLTSKEVTKQMLRYTEQNATFRNIIGHIGIKPRVIVYNEPLRVKGKSEYTFSKMLSLARDALLQNSAVPLQLIFLFGIALTTLSAVGFLITAYYRYIIHSTLFSTVPLFGFFILANNGIIILFIGIIGLYVANMQKQSLNRPMYHITEMKK